MRFFSSFKPTEKEEKPKEEEESVEYVEDKDYFDFLGKNLAVKRFHDASSWEEIDDWISEGYELIAVLGGGGMYAGDPYLLFKTPKQESIQQ